MSPKVSICIACHNQAHLLGEAIASCLIQDFEDFEIVILDDASTDNTADVGISPSRMLKYFRSNEPSGTGGAFNKAISYATGKYIVLLCADDVFTDPRVISDIVNIFENDRFIGHVSRYYHQFVDGDRHPVRAWRCKDVIELANNPSGLAFRMHTINNQMACGKRRIEHFLSNKMFVEASTFVADMIGNGWKYKILEWDTVAVRVHQSIARSPEYYRKMWKTSPVEEWSKVGGKSLQNDFTSLIQISNYFEKSAVIKECGNFIRLNPLVLVNLAFWFYAIISIFTPKKILIKLPDLYRRTWGRWTTREVKRP